MRFIVSVRFLQAYTSIQLAQRKREEERMWLEWAKSMNVNENENVAAFAKCHTIKKWLGVCLHLFISINDLVNYYPCRAIPLSRLRFSGFLYVHQCDRKQWRANRARFERKFQIEACAWQISRYTIEMVWSKNKWDISLTHSLSLSLSLLSARKRWSTQEWYLVKPVGQGMYVA